MGAGCSSPLRRLGGKRGKPNRRNSRSGSDAEAGSVGGLNFNDKTSDSKVCCQQQPIPSTSLLEKEQQKLTLGNEGNQQQQHKFIIENENTIHSEINDDHPSTASYYTDNVKNHVDEGTKISEHSVGIEGNKSSTGNLTTTTNLNDSNNCSSSGGSVMARMTASNGASYVPHDRHLLVSPALSPAPSSCYSPSPALSTSLCNNNSTMLDLNELNEAFKTLTFGMITNEQQQFSKPTTANSQRIKQSERQNLSEMHNNYTQQLVQTEDELVKYLSVIFISTDTFNPTSSSYNSTTDSSNENNTNLLKTSINTESLANIIESNLKSFCDEHLFNLRFLNLGHKHLCKHFHINNLLDASMKILKQEYQENSQQTIVIILSNINNLNSFDLSTNTANNSQQQNLDKRQLPTRIEAQIMNELIQFATTTSCLNKDSNDYNSLLKRWYNQVGNTYYLNPIYLVYPKILSDSIEEHEQAWQNWLIDSNQLIKLICQILETNKELIKLELKSLFNSQIDYILSESALQKRILLIRNYSQTMNNNGSSNLLSNQQSIQLGQLYKDTNLNELTRSIADPNKLTIKKQMNDDEFIKTINDWIIDNFTKYLEGILENQIINGKQIPSYIEKNLFIELSRQRHCLESYINNTTDNFQLKCRNFYNNQISPILNSVINNNNNNDQSTIPTDSLINNQQQNSTNHLVFISGPKGCAKSSLFAQIIKLAIQDPLNCRAQIIYRFCGITSDSITSNRILRSICEQFCQTQGENIAAASYIYSARKEVINSLNKIIQQQTSLIFIDGLNNFNNNNESDLNWLCEIESNQRIKIFITLETDSELYKKALGTYTDATYISLDYPTITEWAQMLTSTARSKRFNSATSLYDQIKNLDLKQTNSQSTTTSSSSSSSSSNDSSQKEFKLTYKDFSNIIHMCRIRKLNNELIYPELSVKMIQNNPIENLKNVHQNILIHLHYLISPYKLCALFILLNSSRNGLSEFDLINLMTMISIQQSKLSSTGGNIINVENKTSSKFSRSLLNYIKIQLKPWLIFILCDKTTVRITIQKDFLSKSLDYYLNNYSSNIMFKNIENVIKDLLLDYFSRSYNSIISSSSLLNNTIAAAPSSSRKLSNTGEEKERLKSSELLWLSTQASEIIHLLILTNPIKAKEHILNKHQFFNQFLYSKMPEEFIEDYEILKNVSTGKKNSTSNEELQFLVNYIKQSIYPLRYDGSQIYSQIYCRAIELIKSGKSSKLKRFNDILNIASSPPMKSLLPISEGSVNSFIRTRIGLNQPLLSSSNSSNLAISSAANTNTSVSATTLTNTTTTTTTTTMTNSSSTSLNAPSNQLAGNNTNSVNAAPTTTAATATTTTTVTQRGGASASGGQPLIAPKQRIYTIKDNHRHVIVIYPDKGTLFVWDIFEERAVRTINNLDQPRDLRMIDKRCAVILCNRELRVYDLDSGQLVNRLKGVMNQKMPFFEVFNENYVVALARNRMYVNMLNLNTGELETTFKVGEDRFLNSLLVSANGGICVCGDETQKPFPLLVWNLNERKLLYDLRIDRHEFLTRMSAISDDGHFVVSVCKQIGDDHSRGGGNNNSSSSSSSSSYKNSPNFIVIYDLNSGTLFKKWKPGLDTCGVAISLSQNRSGKVINCIVNSTILIWDLATGSKRHTLIGHSAPIDVIKVQNNRLFSMDSTCRDQSLRIWDIEEGYCLAVFSPDAPINCCQMSICGDALVCGFAGETRLSTLVMCKNETVNDVVKRNKRRKSSKTLYIFDEPQSRKSSS